MALGDIKAHLNLDAWYMAVVFVGIIGIILAATINVKGLSTQQAYLLSGGLFFFGLGEWNQRATFLKDLEVCYIPYEGRKWNLMGLILNLIGIILIAYALYKIF